MTARGDFSTDRRVILLSLVAIAIGAVCSCVGFGLLKLIALFTNVFYFQSFSFATVSPADSHLGGWAVAVPVLGGLVIGLMAKFGTEKIRGHGIPEALEAILYGKSILRPKVAVLKPLSSAISIGSGGPFGAEGPIIMTGGAFGSIIAQQFHLSAGERKALLVSGAAAGMSVTFASPVAAVLLAVELLLFEWRPRSLIPVALASATAAVLRPWLLDAGPLFPTPAHAALPASVIVFAAVVGIGAGAIASVMSVTLYKVEDLFHRLPVHWMWWPAIGGLVVGLGGRLQPRALGVGYDVIGDLLQGKLAIAVVATLVTVKALIWVVSLGSGTSGGVLAPLLIIGASYGALVSGAVPSSLQAPWALIAMAAIIAGMMRAPFTATIFALELTRDVNSITALLVASVAAYGFTVLVLKRSILTEKVARRGYDIYREYTVDPLEKMKVDEVMSRAVVTIPASMTVSESFRHHFADRLAHRGYPVTGNDGALLGVLSVSDVLDVSDPGNRAVREVMSFPAITIPTGTSCRAAAEKMAAHDIGRLPVTDGTDPSRILGIVSRSDLLKPRFAALREEGHRERVSSFDSN